LAATGCFHASSNPVPAETERVQRLSSQKYYDAVQEFLDTVLEHGRDTFGEKDSPLFVDGLDVETMEPVVWKQGGEEWVLSNFASQQSLLRTLDGYSAITGEKKYRRAAEDAARYALNHLNSKSGLLYWGGHEAYDLKADTKIGGRHYDGLHELKNHQPYYELMYRAEPKATVKLLEGIWGGHIQDWSLLDYNRHADMDTAAHPPWDPKFDSNVKFDPSVEVPFPTDRGNLSFAMTGTSLLNAGSMLAKLNSNKQALVWTRRLAKRWQQARNPKTGLSGALLSMRGDDRAQDALEHVHPDINKAKIVATFYQDDRYHLMPLAQMQMGIALREKGGLYAEVGQKFIDWASSDLKAYADCCYDPEENVFVPRMIDGTLIRWREAKTTSYYRKDSFMPRKADGFVFWSYALAYRLTKDSAHWAMARQLAEQFALGQLGEPNGSSPSLNLATEYTDWRGIYAALELYEASNDRGFLRLASQIGDNLLEIQQNGLFPQTMTRRRMVLLPLPERELFPGSMPPPERQYAQTGHSIPLALLHLATAIEGTRSDLPQPLLDLPYFHTVFDGDLKDYQQKYKDRRTTDFRVFYFTRPHVSQ